MHKPLIILLALSVLLNILLAGVLAYTTLMGCAEVANGRVGVLSQDLTVRHFGGHDTLFKLPKGLVVRDASASGADWFEPYRFRIVVTSDNEHLVDYSHGAVPSSGHDGEFYSGVGDTPTPQGRDGESRER
jgi:hypothetical protein